MTVPSADRVFKPRSPRLSWTAVQAAAPPQITQVIRANSACIASTSLATLPQQPQSVVSMQATPAPDVSAPPQQNSDTGFRLVGQGGGFQPVRGFAMQSRGMPVYPGRTLHDPMHHQQTGAQLLAIPSVECSLVSAKRRRCNSGPRTPKHQ